MAEANNERKMFYPGFPMLGNCSYLLLHILSLLKYDELLPIRLVCHDWQVAVDYILEVGFNTTEERLSSFLAILRKELERKSKGQLRTFNIKMICESLDHNVRCLDLDYEMKGKCYFLYGKKALDNIEFCLNEFKKPSPDYNKCSDLSRDVTDFVECAGRLEIHRNSNK
ncbi:hypothetical protein CHUAL_007785 [Chamberlinius hualienensis]